MIEYLKIEITPKCFAEIELRELSIRVNSDGEQFEKREILHPYDLVSFFDQIWDCAKKEVLKVLKDKVETPYTVPIGVSERL